MFGVSTRHIPPSHASYLHSLPLDGGDAQVFVQLIRQFHIPFLVAGIPVGGVVASFTPFDAETVKWEDFVMSQQKQAPLPRQEFQEWLENAAVPVLVLQKGKHLGSVVKVPATPEIDYLFGCETFYGERISWSDRLEFCGLYDRQHQALHLLDDPLPN